MWKKWKHTLTGGTTLVRLDNRMRAAGHGAGYEHAHLPSRVAEAVPAAIVPAVTLLVTSSVEGEAVAGCWSWDSGGGGDMAAF